MSRECTGRAGLCNPVPGVILDRPKGPAYKDSMRSPAIKSQLKIRRSFRLTIYILCGLAAFHAAAWYILADQLERGIARWADERRADGWMVKHGSVELGGYPLSWRAAIDSPELARQTGDPGFQWSGPAIVLTWEPWRPGDLGFEVTGSHDIALGTHRKLTKTNVTLAKGQGRLQFGPNGALQRLSLLLDGATLGTRPEQALLINRVRAVIDTTPATQSTSPAKPHLIPSVRLNGNIFGLTLPKGTVAPLGRTIGKLVLRGTIMGRIPPGRPADALSVWQKSGGTMEIGHLELGWASLIVQAGGTMALDSSLQPVGALTGKISGYNETADTLVTANLIKPGAAMVAKFALGALSRTPRGGGRPQIEVPLSLQEGWLYVGPVKLLRLPKIRWH